MVDPASGLGEHVNDCWPELVGPADRSLVHWLRRLVFRSAWLDQRVKEGELDVVFDDATSTFGYVQPERDREPIELSPEPNWGRVAYGGRVRGAREYVRSPVVAGAGWRPRGYRSVPRALRRSPGGFDGDRRPPAPYVAAWAGSGRPAAAPARPGRP